MISKTTITFDKLVEMMQDARIGLMQGGTGSSKTYSALQLFATLAAEIPDRMIFSIVSETFPHLRRGAMRDFFNILDDAYCPDNHNKTDATYQIGRSILEFFSADIESKVRGGRRDFLFLNEVNNIPKNTVEQLEVRTRYKIIADFNPVAHFFCHDWVGRPGIGFFVSTYKDNPFLEKSIVESIERRRETDPAWWRVYGLGEVGVAEGLVLPNFDLIDSFPGTHLLDTEFYGLDFGFSNHPTALVHCGIAKYDLYLDELIYETGLQNNQIASRLDGFNIKKNYDEIFADSAEPKSIAEIKDFGYNIKGVEKGADSVRAGLSKMREFRIHITKRSLNGIKEFRNYRYIQNSDGQFTNKPVDDFNHFIDGARYGVHGKLFVKKIDYEKLLQD